MTLGTAAADTALDTMLSPSLWLALHTADPTPAGDTNTELTGGSYARQPITFAAASGKQAGNDAAVSFPDLPAATITHAAVWNAAAGGVMIAYAPYSPSLVLDAGSRLSVGVGGFSLGL